MSDHSELKRLAEAATPGPWVKTIDGVMPVGEKFGIFGNAAATNGEANRKFIAAANPAAVLDLIAELENLRANHEHVVALNHQQFGAAIRSNAERDQLKADNEALRKDAERYRFLRRTDCWADLNAGLENYNIGPNIRNRLWIVGSREEIDNQCDEMLDRSIDYFIDKEKPSD